MQRELAILGITTTIFCMGMQAEAAGFLEEVPLADWSYEAVDGLIMTGHVPDYTEVIPQQRIMSRMEMAMIVNAAINNINDFTPEQQDTIQKLKKEYYYDIKKIQILSKVDGLSSENAASEGETTITKEEKADLKRAAALADKLSVQGYARLRNDHYLRDTGKKTRANMIYSNFAVVKRSINS